MIDDIDLQLGTFKSKEEKEVAVNDLRVGMSSNFWTFLLKILKENETRLIELFANGEKDELMDFVIMKRELRILRWIMNLPKEQLKALTNELEGDTMKEELDPYQ